MSWHLGDWEGETEHLGHGSQRRGPERTLGTDPRVGEVPLASMGREDAYLFPSDLDSSLG